MRPTDPTPTILDGATPLARQRMTRLYDALCHAPSGGLDTRALADRTGIKRREALKLLERMEGWGVVWSVLGNPPIERSRTGIVRWWRRTGAA